jgi:glyoxylase-like metal-dependent hydrolase (beta-lactamase superfamily II)
MTNATTTASAVGAVSVIQTGEAEAHVEHLHGTKKPALWWIFFGRKRERLPINVYVIEHEQGLVLFDAGADRAVATDPGYHGDRITALFNRNIFRWHIEPEDTLTTQLERAGSAAADVRTAVMSHLHADHVGCIAEIPQAELYAAAEGLEYMREGSHPERRFIFRQHIEIPGARWQAIPFAPTEDPALASFTEACDLMGDGSLIVLPTPGHIEGSLSMLVRRGDRPPLLLIGDLTYSESMLMNDQFPVLGDHDQLRASFAAVRALKERMPDLVILPAHDFAAAAKLSAYG